MASMDKLVSLAKRRGFILPSSEIYGGLNGCWDYGPLGVELKRNVKDAWWEDMVSRHDSTAPAIGAPAAFDMVGLDCSILDEFARLGSQRTRRRIHRPHGGLPGNEEPVSRRSTGGIRRRCRR